MAFGGPKAAFVEDARRSRKRQDENCCLYGLRSCPRVRSVYHEVMASISEQLNDTSGRIPAPPELVERATDLVRQFPGCFWFRHPNARVMYIDDVRLVIDRLRKHGNWRAWRAAQQLHRCLSPHFGARRETRDYVDIVELRKTYPLAAICWAACGKDPGFTPLSLLEMMKRFARVDPAKLEEIQARALDPVALKTEWIAMSDEAEAKMIQLADNQPDVPIGVAFVDEAGRPGWMGDDPKLRIHAPSIRGCWPTVRARQS